MALRYNQTMKVFIVGGTGFLGYSTVKALLSHGHSVVTLALEPVAEEIRFPAEVDVHIGDFNALSDAEVSRLMQSCEGLIFAAGVDDRVVPKAPAYPFFYRHNVEACERLFRLAKEAGVKRGVVFSSYFAEFASRWPELALEEKHPYIRSRMAQIRAIQEVAGEDMQVSFLALPYIFGAMPGRVPLWKPLISYLNSALPWVFYPDGGSAMVSVEEVGQAAVAALERGQGGKLYPVCGENLSWVEFLQRLGTQLGKVKPVLTLPRWMVTFAMVLVMAYYRLKGLESGLNMKEFVEIQTRMGFMDGERTRQELGYSSFNLDEALRQTVRACVRVEEG